MLHFYHDLHHNFYGLTLSKNYQYPIKQKEPEIIAGSFKSIDFFARFATRTDFFCLNRAYSLKKYSCNYATCLIPTTML